MAEVSPLHSRDSFSATKEISGDGSIVQADDQTFLPDSTHRVASSDSKDPTTQSQDLAEGPAPPQDALVHPICQGVDCVLKEFERLGGLLVGHYVESTRTKKRRMCVGSQQGERGPSEAAEHLALQEKLDLEIHFKALVSKSGCTEIDAYLRPEVVRMALSTLGTSVSDEDWNILKVDRFYLEDFVRAAREAHRLHLIKTIIQDANLGCIWSKHFPGSARGVLTMSPAGVADILRSEEFIKQASAEIHKCIIMHQINNRAGIVRGTNSKYASEGGLLATHGDDNIFHGGLENVVGLPDPRLMRAIFHEHLIEDGSQQGFLTSNYQLWTKPEEELAFVLGRDDDIKFLHEVSNGNHSCTGPTRAELEDLKGLLERLRKVNEAILNRSNGKYAGEIGDTIADLVVTYKVQGLEAINSLCKARPISSNELVPYLKFDFTSTALRDEFDLNSEFSARLKFAAVNNDSISLGLISLILPIAEQQFTENSRQILLNGLTAIVEERIMGEEFRLQLSSVSERVWTFVEHPNPANLQKQGRRRMTLRELMSMAEVANANLRVEEAVAGTMYTGPMFNRYNAVLRNVEKDPDGRMIGFRTDGNKYTTTLHCLTSTILKMSRQTALPSAEHRKLWRGLGGIALDDSLFFEFDDRGTRGGVELGFMSTTTNKETALMYSGQNVRRGTILELEYDKINCPAKIDSISMYPGEGEMLYSPMTCLEHVGNPRLETYNGESVLVLSIKVNKNPNAQTVDRVIARRKELAVTMVENLMKEIMFDLKNMDSTNLVASSDADTFPGINFEPSIESECAATASVKVRNINQKLGPMQSYLQNVRELDPSWFNNDENFKTFWNKALETKLQIVFEDLSPWILSEAANGKSIRDLKGRYAEEFLLEAMRIGLKSIGIIENNVNELNQDAQSSLILQSEKGDADHVRLLLFARAKVDFVDRHGKTAISYATMKGHTPVVSMLLSAGAIPSPTDMFDAVKSKFWPIVTLLAGCGIRGVIDVDTGYEASGHISDSDSPHYTYHVRSSPLLCASQSTSAEAKRACVALIEADANLEIKQERGVWGGMWYFSPVLCALETNNADSIRALINADADLEQNVRTLLYCSTYRPDWDEVKTLTPIELACARGYPDVVRALLEAGIEVDADTIEEIRSRKPADNKGILSLICGYSFSGTEPQDHQAALRVLEEFVQ